MSEQMAAVSAVLRDGGQVSIRQADAGDEPELAAFYARLGVHDGHLWARGRSAAAGAGHEAALVPIGQSVTAWANGELIGVADYRTLGSTREAEVTVAVTGRWRGRGIETLLLEHLISSARQRGIESFHADVRADNDEHVVVLDVQTAGEARSTYRRLAARFGDRPSGVLVQQMIPPGTEMLIGFVRDPVFGPLVQVGAGGVTTDLVKDRAARLLPLTDRDARDMIGALRMAPLLTGFRDAPPLDVAALTDVLHRVARLAADLPSVAELDINPLILCPSGCTAIDTKIRVAPAHVIDPYLRELR